MKIQVTFTTQVKAALGKSQQSLTLEPGSTVTNAIEQLATEHTKIFEQFVLLNGKLLPSILTSVNDRQVEVTEPLADGDHLILLSAISGG